MKEIDKIIHDGMFSKEFTGIQKELIGKVNEIIEAVNLLIQERQDKIDKEEDDDYL